MHGVDGLPKECRNNCCLDQRVPQPALPQQSAPDQAELVNAVLDGSRDLEEFLELYYWSREPEVLSLFRSLARLPLSTRKALEFFLSQGGDSVVLSLMNEGGGWKLTLQLDAKSAGQADASLLPA